MESLAATLTAVTVIVLATLSAVDTSGCDRDTGPGGVSMCLQFKGYDGPQWGACLTTIYVDRISRGKHQCIENSSTYCWYQCMIETHDEADGNVTADCACDAFSSTETNTTLNHTCYSPPGDVCSWYRDCLERKFPCRESSDNYAIAYAENMCNLYGQQKDELSSQGAYWLDVVRKCLQVVLVPLLRPFESGHVTCDTVRKHALKSHASCYTDPYLQAPSICDLSASDLWTVFWGVRGRFTSYFVESLYGLIQVAKNCGSYDLLQLMGKMRKMTVRLDIQALGRRKRPVYVAPNSEKLDEEISSRERREAEPGSAGMAMMNPDVDGVRVARQVSSAAWMGETAEALDFHRLAAQATYTLDTQLGWRAGDVIAFAYGQRISAEFLNVHILLADRHAYGLQDDAYARRPDMTQLVELAAEKVELDEVTVTLDNQPAPIASFMACSDIDCRKVYREVNRGRLRGSTESPTGSATTSVGSWMVTALLAAAALFVTQTSGFASQIG